MVQSFFSICKLQKHDEECDENITELRQDYAKIALMMFWLASKSSKSMELAETLFQELKLSKKNENTKMWKKRFKLLQNTENPQLLQCNSPKRLDYITKHTIN